MRPVMAPVAVHRARTTPITIMSTPPPWFSSERLRLSWRSEIVSRGTTPWRLSMIEATVSLPAITVKRPSVTRRAAGIARKA